jgi:anti-anti-sigma factor
LSEDDGSGPASDLDGEFLTSEVALEPLPDASVVRLCGDIDLSTSDELSAVCASALERAVPVRLDLSEVTFIDSTALGFVARLAAAERDSGRTLPVRGASRRTLDTIRLIGLEDMLDLGSDSGLDPDVAPA